MNFFNKASIKSKQVLIIMAITSVALLLACMGFTCYEVLTFRSAMVRNLSTLADIIGHNTATALDFDDPTAAAETLSALKAQSHIAGACVYSANGRVFATYRRFTSGPTFTPPSKLPAQDHSFQNGNLALSRPIISKGDAVGTVYLVSDIGELYTRLGQYAVIIAAVLVLTLIIALALSRKMQQFVSEPILQLAGAAKAVGQNKDYSIRVPRHNPDEIGVLIDGFNGMLDQIQSREMELRKAKEVLEIRVKERTIELADANTALQKENLERKQAEEALRSQEERTRLIIDQAFDAVMTLDTEFQIIDWNRAAEKTLGWPREEIMGRNLIDTIVPSDRRELRRSHVEQFRTTGEWPDLNRLVQTTAICRDGRELPVELTVTPIRLGDRFIFTIFLRDITERKQAEATLAFERHLLESLLETAEDCIYFKDRDSRILRCSKSQVQRFGGGLTSLVGKTDFDLFDEAHARPAFEDEQEIIHSGRRLIGKVEREVAKDGRESWALTSKMPLRNRDGEIVGTFGISKDITAIKQAEAKLEQTHKELVQASRIAGMAEVATNVLHNVGNVLNSINIAASLVDEKVRKSRVADVRRLARLLDEHAADRVAFLTSDPKGRKVPEFVSQLAEQLASEQAAVLEEISALRCNVEHVKEIIAMQQSYARVSGVFENVKVSDLLEDTLRMNAGSLQRHEVKIVRDFNGVPPICTDKHKVLQILINLVRNAKYACDDSGRKDKQVILRAVNEEDRVKIAVIDNGVGIPPENLTRIFNHGFTTRKDGHGFGLHSGALAAKELGGSLTVHSDGPGHGATFTLELPCQPPTEEDTEMARNRLNDFVTLR